MANLKPLTLAKIGKTNVLPHSPFLANGHMGTQTAKCDADVNYSARWVLQPWVKRPRWV